MLKKPLTTAFLIGLVCVSRFQAASADEIQDRFVQDRQELVDAKAARAENLGRQVQALQNQLQEERRQLSNANDKLWKDFVQTLEVERKELKDQVEKIDQKQKLFEMELERKRQQDETRLKERELEIKKNMKDMDRLLKEIEEDKKALADIRSAQNGQLKSAKDASRNMLSDPGDSEMLKNGSVKISRVRGDQNLDKEFGARKSSQEYYVEEGDTLGLDFWRAKELSRRVTVRPDGRISLPLVGDLDVVGLSLTEVRDLISSEYKEYIRDPEVSIAVESFGGRKFIILGEVHSPGVYRYQQSISLIEAVGLAGGLNNDANKGQIAIIRGDIHKTPQVKLIGANVANILKKGMLSENLTVMPNDIIYVSRDFLGDYNDFLDEVIKPAMDTAIDFFVLRSAIRTAQDRRN